MGTVAMVASFFAGTLLSAINLRELSGGRKLSLCLGWIGEIVCVYVLGRNIWLRLCAIEQRFVVCVCVWEFEVGVVGGVIEQPCGSLKWGLWEAY